MSQRSTLLPPELDLLVAWEDALLDLIAAARDSAEFAADKPLGRSRTRSLRTLRAAVQQIDKLSSSSVHRTRPSSG